MSRATVIRNQSVIQDKTLIGVGLRHPHYQDALQEASSIDFVELHAENFFAKGGATNKILDAIRHTYAISLHGTSMGLGSATPISSQYLAKFHNLVDQVNPLLVSDHACFTWGSLNGSGVHSGDLLPLEFNQQSLAILIDNVDRVQQLLGRQILVENISSYLKPSNASMQETEFLTTLAERSQCALLVDLNNILVNAHNSGCESPIAEAKKWLAGIPGHLIKEIHLAGYTPAAPSKLIIDDHSQPVSEECWHLFRYCMEHCGPVPTLIEWDNALPPWQTLLDQAAIARTITNHVSQQPLRVAP